MPYACLTADSAARVPAVPRRIMTLSDPAVVEALDAVGVKGAASFGLGDVCCLMGTLACLTCPPCAKGTPPSPYDIAAEDITEIAAN